MPPLPPMLNAMPVPLSIVPATLKPPSPPPPPIDCARMPSACMPLVTITPVVGSSPIQHGHGAGVAAGAAFAAEREAERTAAAERAVEREAAGTAAAAERLRR